MYSSCCHNIAACKNIETDPITGFLDVPFNYSVSLNKMYSFVIIGWKLQTDILDALLCEVSPIFSYKLIRGVLEPYLLEYGR